MKSPTTDIDINEITEKSAKVQKNKAKKVRVVQMPVADVFAKKHGRLHPEAVGEYVPLLLPTDKKLDDEARYWGLTDQSMFSEYAWAFLRRNRFYQRLIDGQNPNLTIENWEYAIDSDLKSPVGLVDLKHYQEKFASGTPVKWWGIHSFAEGLKMAVPTNRRNQVAQLDWPKTQVSLTFDVNSLLGEGTAAIDVQLAMAKVHLHALARDQGVLFPAKNKPPSKSLLRAQLRVIDLLSTKHTPPLVTSQELNSTSRQPKKTKNIPKCWLSISQAAALMPKFDFKKKLSAEYASAKKERSKRVSELMTSAWRNMYRWEFLSWLQFDNWDHLVPTSKVVAPAKTLSRT